MCWTSRIRNITTNKTYDYVFVNNLVIMNLDEHLHGQKYI